MIVWTRTSVGPLVWNLIPSLVSFTVSLLSAFATRSVVTLPEPGDPRATVATVPTIAIPTAAMTRRRWFLFILGMILPTFLLTCLLLAGGAVAVAVQARVGGVGGGALLERSGASRSDGVAVRVD